MLRRARVPLLALCAGLLAALAPAAPARADDVSYADAACTRAEDPVNLRLIDVRLMHQRRGGPVTRLYGAAAARWVTDQLFQQPKGAGSSRSYHRFAPGVCVDQTAWVTNHSFWDGGVHARFWQNGSAWRSVWGAAHREALCRNGARGNHKVDDFNDARDMVAAAFDWVQSWRGRDVWEIRRVRARPPRTFRKTCSGGGAVAVVDDGIVVEIRAKREAPFPIFFLR